MDITRLKSKWNEINDTNRFQKNLIVGLMVLNALMLYGWLNKERTVVLVPPMLNEQAEVTAQGASGPYKKAWGLFAAMMLGNVTPDNASFILKALETMVDGNVLQQIHEQVAEELDTLRTEKVASVFEPRQVAYEQETGKIFISGRQSLTGAGGKTSFADMSFEMTIDLHQFAPLITHLELYPGPPRTAELLQRDEERRRIEAETRKARPPQP